MTAITASTPVIRAGAYDRMLLRAASALDGHVAARLERRSAPAYRRALQTRSETAAVRDRAVACGAIGLLPR